MITYDDLTDDELQQIGVAAKSQEKLGNNLLSRLLAEHASMKGVADSVEIQHLHIALADAPKTAETRVAAKCKEDVTELYQTNGDWPGWNLNNR